MATPGRGLVLSLLVLSLIVGSPLGWSRNLAPAAPFTYSPSAPTTDDTVLFTDTSVDADGNIVSWAWDFGDGSAADVQNPAHSFQDSGSFTVSLTVTDNEGGSDTKTAAVTVSLPPPEIGADEAIAILVGQIEEPASSDERVSAFMLSEPPRINNVSMWNAQNLNRGRLIELYSIPASPVAGGGQPTVVAILDTGIDADNQELGDRVVGEVNFTESPTSDDLHGHGTHMAGTVAAIAPNCRFLNVKVADDRGRCEASSVARGIDWAVNRGAQVINMSLCTEPSLNLGKAIDYAWSRGVVVVAAAGNEGMSMAAYPACYGGCLAVAATNQSDSLAVLSNHGDGVDVAAPGFKVYSTLPDDQYGYETGTSPAAAHVSGVAALVFSVVVDGNGNGMVNDEVRQAIEGTCSWIGVGGVGNGLVNAFEAARAAVSLA